MKLNTLRVEKRDFLVFVEGIADDELVAHTFTFPCPSFSVHYTLAHSRSFYSESKYIPLLAELPHSHIHFPLSVLFRSLHTFAYSRSFYPESKYIPLPSPALAALPQGV